MKAFLLAAGEGTRLRPITYHLPKCLVPINGKPLLEYWLENLSNAGIEEFLINTHYKYQLVKEFVDKSQYRDKITLVYEEELLNTGGSLLENRDFFMQEPFMIVHADNLSLCNFDDFIQTHTQRYAITMMLFESDNPSSCGVVELDKQGIVQTFHEKVQNPPSNLANGAVYICESSIFDFLENLNQQKIDFSLDVLPNFMGNINTFINKVYHRDIGTPLSYALSQVEILKFLT